MNKFWFSNVETQIPSCGLPVILILMLLLVAVIFTGHTVPSVYKTTEILAVSLALI